MTMRETVERWDREGARLSAERREERRERATAGMGFWRLVCIVALGILAAQGVAAILARLVALFVKVTSPV